MRLNRDRPYGQVFGLGGVQWQQDGRYFNFGGAEVDENGASVGVEPEPVKAGRPPADEEARLRAQMEIYGEEWKGVKHARQFLEGKAS